MALNAPYRPGDRLAAVEHTALTLLHKVAPRMIVVDEVHNLLAGSAHEQRASLNLPYSSTLRFPSRAASPDESLRHVLRIREPCLRGLQRSVHRPACCTRRNSAGSCGLRRSPCSRGSIAPTASPENRHAMPSTR
jgi:hypothetical protein